MLCGYIAGLVPCPLQRKEDMYRTANPSWVDQPVAPEDIRRQWQEAQANRRMLFKVGDYERSEVRMLTGTLKADWIQLPVEVPGRASYIEAGCHCRRVQDQRRLCLSYLQSREATSLCLSPQ